MRQLDPTVVSALDRLDASTAALACEAVDLITLGGPLSEVTQLRLQAFLWTLVPRRWPPERWLEVAGALGALLEGCGLERYAGICRSSQTRSCYRAWKKGIRTALRRVHELDECSGVLPSDVPALEWSWAPGPRETDILVSLSITLEMAIQAGEFVPGKRGWRQRRAEIVQRELTRPRADGAPYVEAIMDERVAEWASMSGPARFRIVQPFAEQLVRPIPFDGGFPVVDRILRDLEHPPDSEEIVQAILLDMEAVHPYKEALLPSGLGEAMAADPQEAWRETIAHLWGGDGFHEAVAELAFAVLLDEGEMRESDLVDRIHPAIASEWRDAFTDASTKADEVRLSLIRLAMEAEALGVLRVDGRIAGDGSWPDRLLSLTPPGRSTALQALRIRATAPVRPV